MKRFLIVQIRPEDEAADNELEAFLKFGGLDPNEIHRVQADREEIPDTNLENYAGVIIGGGPSNVSSPEKQEYEKRMEKGLSRLIDQVVEKDIPFLGACYGFGALIHHQGGVISKEKYSEVVGAITISLTNGGVEDPLTKALPKSFRAFGGHKEACQIMPDSAVLLASSDYCPTQMIRVKNNIYATQFHPELDTDGIVVRINVYKHAGYFPPEDAVTLIEQVRQEEVTVPVQIMKNFVDRFRKS